MKHLQRVSSIRQPQVASSAPFSKVCLISGGQLEDGGDTCALSSESSRNLFEILASIKGVPYSIS